jgi:hypothetical protein
MEKEKAADVAAFHCWKRDRVSQPPLPPITARTVSSGPKSSAPST